MNSTGKNFKDIRTAKGLSQEAFGDLIGLSKSGVSAVENNKTFLSLDILRTLLVDQNVNLNFLVNGKGPIFMNICENTHILIKNEQPALNFKDWGKRFAQLLADVGETPLSFSLKTSISESRIEKFILYSIEPTVEELTQIKCNVDISLDELLYGQIVEKEAQNNDICLSPSEIIALKQFIMNKKS